MEESDSETVVSHGSQRDREGLADRLCFWCRRFREELELSVFIVQKDNDSQMECHLLVDVELNY